MAKKTKVSNLSLEERLEQALIPNWDEPYKVPSNWCWIKLGAVCSLENGEKSSEKELVYLDAKTLRGTAEPQTRDSGIIVNKNQKVILVDGENSGEVFVVPYRGYMGSTFKIINIADNADEIYTRYFIDQNREKLRKNKIGSAIPHLNKDLFFNLELPFPPFNEQKRIVAHIESLFAKLDEAKEKAQEVVDGFDTRKAAILNRAFSGELTTAWRKWHSAIENTTIKAVEEYSLSWTKKEQRLLHDEQQKAAILTMSDGHNWIKCTIGAVARVNNGSTPSRQKMEYWNGDIPWVSSGEVRNNYIYDTLERITKDGFENSSVKLLPVDTVLIAMIGEGKTRGQSAVLKIPATTNQNVAAIIMDHGLIVGEYMWYWLQMNYSKNREKGSGSGQQALNCQRVRELEFVFPGYEEQKEIVRILDNLILKEQQVKENAEAVIKQIGTIKEAILARAFRGELGTNDPTEESSVELLKSIVTVGKI